MATARRLRVLQVITELRPGGAERVLLELMSRIDRERFDPVVAALDGRGEYGERIQAVGVPVVDLGAPTVYHGRALLRLRSLIRAFAADLVHTHLFHASIAGRLAAGPLNLGGRPVPTVASCHIVERRAKRWHFWLNRWTMRWCRRVVCVSEAVRAFQQARLRLPPERFTVIYNGLDMSRFANPSSRATARARLEVPAESALIGALGRLDRQKGFDVLIRAFAEPPLRDALGPDGRPVRLVLGGYGPEEPELRRVVARLRLGARVTFAGLQAGAEHFLPAMDVVAVPSRWEGFGLVTLESMALGLPTVASRVDSIPEVLRDGVDGLLLPAEAVAAWSQGLADLIADPPRRATYAKQGQRRAQDFTASAMTQQHESLYREIVADDAN